MNAKLKSIINRELRLYLRKKIGEYKLSLIDKLLSKSIEEFVLRDGKRIRPIFFLISYLGFSKNKTINRKNLQTSLAFELLHDFLLIHDDIIDNSNTRRGKPTLHKVFEHSLKLPEATGKDLSIIAGDIVFTMAVDAFSGIESTPGNKQKALSVFLNSTALTGAGEYKDVLNGLMDIKKVKIKDIRMNYLLKTAEYTFKAPLVCGAILAGTNSKQIKKIKKFSECLGQAFQIQDDLIGIFAKSKNIGKSVLSDIIEAKKTLPLFLAYKKLPLDERKFLSACLGNKKLRYSDLQKIRKLIINCGAYAATKNEIRKLLSEAQSILEQLSIRQKYKKLLNNYIHETIKI